MEIKREFVELNPQPLGRPKTKHIKIIIETHAYLSRLMILQNRPKDKTRCYQIHRMQAISFTRSVFDLPTPQGCIRSLGKLSLTPSSYLLISYNSTPSFLSISNRATKITNHLNFKIQHRVIL